jgi:lipoprotein signal peptidase
MTRRGLIGLGIATAAVVFAADQASKWWVVQVLDLRRLGDVALLPVLDLTYVENRGITFGLLNSLCDWSAPALGVGALLVVAALGVWLTRAERPLVAAAIGAIAGGAVGNVIDRLRSGAVVDFIRAHAWGWSWYVFNAADAAIVCGVAALILDGLRTRRHDGLAGADGRR